MLLNLESSKALLSTVKVMMINAGVVVSPSAVQNRKEIGMTKSYRTTGHSEYADCSSLLELFYSCMNPHI